MAATSRPSDDRVNDERLSQLDLPPSTSTTQQQQHQKNSRESETRRRCGCKDQRNNVPYMIEDLDAIELAPVDDKSASGACGCEQVSSSKQLEDLRKHRSTETRWSNSFLSPDDARWNPRKLCAGNSTEFRWALHTSSTDVDIARSARMKCDCHSLTPVEKKPPERGDLRKHHSAETDKWTLRPDVVTPRPDLRKHNSDDARMDRQQAKWTLQVPEVLPNPKPRCACSKMTTTTTTTTKKLSPSSATPEKTTTVSTVVEMKAMRHASENSRWTTKDERTKDRTIEGSQQEGSVRNCRPGKSHVSVTTEKNGTKWTRIHGSLGETCTKDCSRSVREIGQRSAVRKSVSPKSDDARALSPLRTDEGIKFARRPPVVMSPEITITDSKWTSYEKRSPLPNVGNKKKRQQIRIGDIKWIPYDGSSTDLSYDQDHPMNWSPFRHVTPTCYPPPLLRDDDSDDEARWKLLNEISPFPIYQGAWRDDSPPIWSPQESSPLKKSLATGRSHLAKDRKQHESEDRPIEVRPITQAPRGNRQRPQLLRSKALLEVPVMDSTKRSLSEEVPRYRMNDHGTRGPNRARSEEASKYENPWFANNLVFESAELCQYVTTV